LSVVCMLTPLRCSTASPETPFNDDAARSSAQVEVCGEDHSEELTVTESHRDLGGEAVGEAGSSPCSHPCPASPL